MEVAGSSSEEDCFESATLMEDYEEINDDDLKVAAEEDGVDISPLDIEENEPVGIAVDADETEVERQESSKVVTKASYEAKLRELLRNLYSVEVKIYSEASKDFVRILRGETGGELLYQYVNASPLCSELVEAWKMRREKPGVTHVLSLILAILDHPDGKYKLNDIGRITVSRRLDKLSQTIIDSHLEDVYAELNSKEARRQNAVLLLMAAIVRRGVGLASEVAKKFNFKLPLFSKLAEYQKNRTGKRGKYSTRRSFIEFALSFLEVGNPRLLRWILQQKDMYSGILLGLGSDDDETIVYVLSTLRDRVLTPDSLVPPGLRSVLFGSGTLDQLISISGDPAGGPATNIAHEVLVKVCTDSQNGLMPDMKSHTNPLKGNIKRLLDLMKKLKAIEIGCHRDLLLAIVCKGPSIGSSYMDEFPYIVEPRASHTWFATISLGADLVSAASTSGHFGTLASQKPDPPSLDSSEVQCMLKCIIPRAFSRVVINRGLLHADALVRHGSVRLLLEALKSLDCLLSVIDSNSHSTDSAARKWLSLKQEIQDEARALLPDPQVLVKLLSSLSHNDSKSCDVRLKRARKSEVRRQDSAKKMKIDMVNNDIDIVISGINGDPDDSVFSETKNTTDVLTTEDLDGEKECLKIIAGIWGFNEYAVIGNELKDAEIYLHSKLLDVLTLYLRTLPITLEGSFDFLKMLPSNPFTLSTNQQQSLLSLLIEYTGWSPGTGVSIRLPEMMYKYLQPLINLLIYSPVKSIKDQAYTLARAAVLSTGAFDRNIWEVDAWLLFLPGYRQEKLPAGSSRVEVFQDFSAAVVSFFCDAVSTVGNNLYKYLDQVKFTVSNLKDPKDMTVDFSPLIICILKKCLRLLDSNSTTFKLSEKSIISIYVSNTICFLLQTQVHGTLLSAVIDAILTERLGDCSSLNDDSGKFLCEWRPLKSLLLFSRNLSHQQACSSSSSMAQKSLDAKNHHFTKTLGKVKEFAKKAHGGDLVGLGAAFCSSVICATPDEILENFPSVITISRQLLGGQLSFIWSVLFIERNLLSAVADLWPDIFLSSLELVDADTSLSYRNDTDPYSPEGSISAMEYSSEESISVAFSIFLKEAPFFMLFPSVIGIGMSTSLISNRLVDILQLKLSEGSPDDCISYLRLILFWVNQLQSSYKVKPVDDLEKLAQIFYRLINPILERLLVIKSDSDGSATIEAPAVALYVEEVLKIIFHHPAVIMSLSHPLCYDEKLIYRNSGDSFEGFLRSSNWSVHPMDYNVLQLLTKVADYLIAFSNDHCAASALNIGKTRHLKVFTTLVQRVVMVFRGKFDLCVESRDLMPLLPIYHIVHALVRFMSPLELLELAHWIFCTVDRNDFKGWKSSKVSAFSVGCYIAASAFDLISDYVHKKKMKTISSCMFWESEGESFDVSIIEEVYNKVIEIASTFKLESADLCLLKAVKAVHRHKLKQSELAVFPSIAAVSRVTVSSPLKILVHCVNMVSVTKAKFLHLLTEISPLHLTLFGKIFSGIIDKRGPLGSNGTEGNCSHVLSDEELMMLLPAASSYLNWNITKFGVQYLKTCESIPTFYSKIILDGFINWKAFVSRNIFQDEIGESVPSSTQDFLNHFSGSLLGNAIHMLRYYFALNEGSRGIEKRIKLFNSIYPCFGAHDELLDCDIGEINICSINHSLNIMNRVIAKITFSRLLLFPKDNFIQHLLTETSGDPEEIPWGMGSNREDSPKLRFMSILVSTLHMIVRRFPLVTDTSEKSKSTDASHLFRLLETFILKNIVELSRELRSDLIQLNSLPFLEQFIRSSLVYRFEDPITLKVLSDVLMTLSEGKFSCHVVLELLLSHSQFISTILWSDSISDSSGVSHAGTLLRPISSILKSHVLVSDLHETDGKDNIEVSLLYRRKLEVVKLLRVLYYLKAHQKGFSSEEGSMNARELLSLLLSCYGATTSEIDREIYSLMHDIVSTEGSDCKSIAEMDYLWGSAAMKLRKEKMLENVMSSNNITDCETSDERRRRQFRENFGVDPTYCLTTVLHFPYDRVECDGPMSSMKLLEGNLMDMLETPSARTDTIKRYDPAFILRCSIHGLSMGYLEHFEFAGLGLLAIAIMSISSPDEGIRKLGYEALGRFKNALEDSRNKKGGLRLRLLLTYLQNGIAEPWQKIPSVTAMFAAEASVILLDPSHDHYLKISKMLLRSPRVNLKSIPLFHTLFESSTVNFKADRLWILRLSYAGLNLDDDAQIFMRKCLLEMLLGYYSSSLSDYESKIVILQIVKKSVKLHTLARYLVEHCGLIPWLSSVVCYCGERLFKDHNNIFLKHMSICLEVVNDVISKRTISEFLQKHALEQLSELSSHLYKLLVGSLKMIDHDVALVDSILQILVTTLRISQKRKIFQPHFNLSCGGLYQLWQVIYEEPSNSQSSLRAELVLRVMLMGAPAVVDMDSEKMLKLVLWGTSVASLSVSEETFLLGESEVHFASTFGDQQSKESLVSILLRWVTASVILGKISRKEYMINSISSHERANIKTLQSLLENIKNPNDMGTENHYDQGRKDDSRDEKALAATILYLQQLLGTNRKVLRSVVSALCLLLLSGDSDNTGTVSWIGDQRRLIASLCSKISCPLEANPSWRWSFHQPWKDLSSEPTNLQVVDEYHACETLLVIFSNALGKGASSGLPVLSHQDLKDSGVFPWERNILTTQLSFK